MKNGIVFLVLGATLSVQAMMFGGLYWFLAWPGISLAVVAVAYFGVGPGVFGKRPDGTLAWWSVTLLLPYLLLAWLTWHLIRLTSREDCCNEVAPGLFIGRRPLANEVPKDVTLIVDLTCEFAEARAVRTKCHYISLLILDAGVLAEAEFQQVVRQVMNWPGPVYIHCAQGHGRTGMVAAAVMVAKGHAATVEEAIAAMKRVRPRLALGKIQLAFLHRTYGNSGGESGRTAAETHAN